MPNTMRGVYTNLTEIRRKVFREVARVAYTHQEDLDTSWVEELPYQIIPGESATYRESIFLERAIVAARIRLAMGLNLLPVDQPSSVSEGIREAEHPERYYEPPLINVIKFACHACPEDSYIVTDQCQGCLAHPCREICPKGAITFVNHRAHIDQDKCIKCGRCKDVCPYTAILHRARPCAAACGMHCIGSDEYGHADIDYSRCVSCGQCLVNCPFGAIADKSQIFQVIKAIQSGAEVIAAVAPAFVGQYGGRGDVGKLREAFTMLGFAGVEEVAIGADLCTVQESEDFLEEVPDKLPFMATSCCPAWAMMAKKDFPDHAKCISMALTPMTLTARYLRQLHPEAKIVFVGPCSAKKLEAMRESVRSEVDFVLTFEEVYAMMEALEIDYTKLPKPADNDFSRASADGRGFAVAGGVANAVVNAIHKTHPDREVNVASAEGLDNCRALLRDATKGKYPGYLLEGMACPGGCVAGPGTLKGIKQSQAQVKAYMKRSPLKNATEDGLCAIIPELMAMGDDEPGQSAQERMPAPKRAAAPEVLTETDSIDVVDEPAE
ncbi:4Fe-4S dicluster domain-containing protein [Olsenella sp. YH-ols2217]|uniref:4Fe-4S dicluster domain-containing protein n=1 Tax=Kribbibacterium absianum TaxID=3044210 RepID=A0ABT6ZHK8_9ACTN|nr:MULTISPECIES: 4Fe-4S dicluster domain-containing protein [unclassified Olsenella]MDJ1121049.1 4Fe-4S dicluster domain-containing protein [Olsenella sp. YH-ols2216]MDJ1128540.1 4Fe-4S dicluster domain-containing protein [Olsenella sp. YH-ols2217]